MANFVLQVPNTIRSFAMFASSNPNVEFGIAVSAFPLQTIDVLEVDGVYYGFSGCHRYEAHQRLGLPTIRCKIRRGTKETLRHHLR